MRASCLLLLALLSGVLALLSPPKTSKFKCLRNGCCDEHEWCRFWASIGECEANPTWMTSNCQLACNSCRAFDSLKKPKMLNKL
ncbi:Peroxidase mlt-7 [Toxocara canis]|uniref:Peroxidase mlt-7 n=1 Tax=Toxocara canis TaxID=6265 RepID=A0A0B2UW00_TOXCA|nr:Peroxidase mlt-7 [Toxocara canis]